MVAPTLHPRHHALAELDRLIEQAELAQNQQRAEFDRIVAEGREPRRPLIHSAHTPDRLVQLRKSREALLSGEDGK